MEALKRDEAIQAMHLVFSKTLPANPGNEVCSIEKLFPKPRRENLLLPLLFLVPLDGSSFSSELLISQLVSICGCFPRDGMLLILLFFLLLLPFFSLLPSEPLDLPWTCELGFPLSMLPLSGVSSISPSAVLCQLGEA